jgi:uncharacterized heparinase superfamily protein
VRVSVTRFLRSVAHTRPRQLLERLRSLAWQRFHDASPTRVLRALEGPPPPVSSLAPLPVFAPRRDRALVRGEEAFATFLNIEHSLARPVDWACRTSPDLERFHLHYMEYLEALDDERFRELVAHWIERNPLEERGSWRAAWHSYVVSLRSVVWMQQFALRGPRVGQAVREFASASLARQLRLLERRLEVDLGGNHLLKNAKALLWASRYFAGDEARRWGAVAEGILRRETREQILGDGVHFERSPSYHAQVFADLVECAHVAEGTLRDVLVRALSSMAQPLADLTHPDGSPSLFNDGGLHMSYGAEECLAAFERVTGEPRPEPREVFALEHSGYFGARAGSSLFVADCGALAPDHLPAHGHGDALAFEWSVGGRRLIVDAGVYEYRPGQLRDEARTTRNHNTITLDDLDQAEFYSAFRVGRRPSVRCRRFETLGHGFVLEGSHDGYRHLPGAPVHVRRFIVGRDALVIDDSIDGGARQVARARLLLHPDVDVRPLGRQSVVLRTGEVAVLLESRHPITVVEAAWFPNFGVRVPTRQLVIHMPPAPCRGTLRLQRMGATTLDRTAIWSPSVARESGGAAA